MSPFSLCKTVQKLGVSSDMVYELYLIGQLRYMLDHCNRTDEFYNFKLKANFVSFRSCLNERSHRNNCIGISWGLTRCFLWNSSKGNNSLCPKDLHYLGSSSNGGRKCVLISCLKNSIVDSRVKVHHVVITTSWFELYWKYYSD